MAISTTEQTNIVRLVVGMFNAAPGATYLNDIVNVYEANGHNLTALAGSLANTGAFHSIYSSALTAQQFATAFLTTLGLQFNTEANDFIVLKANTPESRGQIILEAITALEGSTSATFAAAKAMLDNKTEVALFYSVAPLHVAETSLGVLQNVLSTITADHATVVAQEAALSFVPPITLTLTTGVDILNPAAGVNSIVNGIADAAGTFTVGDTITANATTVVNLALVANTPSISTITGAGTVNINALNSTTLNLDLWSAVGAVNLVSPTIAGTTTTLSNAQVATSFGDASGNAANLTVTFRDTSGAADTARVGLLGTGTSATVRSVIDVSSANTVEGLAITSSGNNFAVLNGGTADKTIAIGGSGVNDISFGATAAVLTVDASAATGNQKMTFVSGSIDSADTIKGGSGTGDQVTANNMTTAVHMSGVETLVTTFEGGVFFAGENITGLKTLTANEPTAPGNLTLSNMNAELSTVNVNGPVGKVTVNYTDAAHAPTLTVNYGDGTTKDTDFDTLRVRNVADVTVNFNGTADLAANGNIDLDKDVTTGLTVKATGSVTSGTNSNTVGAIVNYDSLTHLTVSATGTNSEIFIQDLVAHDTTASQLALQTITVSATGTDSSAYLRGFDGSTSQSSSSGAITAFSQALSLSSVTVTASGDDSTAEISDSVLTAGHMSTVTVTASGDGAFAYFSSLTVAADAGGHSGLDTVNILASGDNSDATMLDIFVSDGNLQTVTIVASGQSADARLSNNIEVVNGNIGSILVEASGPGSFAMVSDIFTTNGDLGTLRIVASGSSSNAQLTSDFSIDGNVGTIDVIASGANSFASFSGDSMQVDGDVGQINLTASGASAQAAALFNGGSIDGNLGSVTILASGANSSASFDSTLSVFGSVDTINVTASGNNANASNFWMSVSGDVGSETVTASGLNSFAFAGFTHTTGVTGNNLGALTVVASGVDSTASGSAFVGDGIINTVTATASNSGAQANVLLEADAVHSMTLTAAINADVFLQVNETTHAGILTATGAGDFDVDFLAEGPTSVIAGAVTGVFDFNAGSSTGGIIITTGSGADLITTGGGADTIVSGAGNDTIVAGAGKDTINGGSGSDSITGGTGADAMTGGTGADTFVIATGATGITVATADSIADFATTSDKLKLGIAGDATAGTGNYVENAAAVADFAAALVAANTALGTLNGTSAAAQLHSFQFDATNGYLFEDTNSDGTADQFIVLVGITSATIAAGDIIV